MIDINIKALPEGTRIVFAHETKGSVTLVKHSENHYEIKDASDYFVAVINEWNARIESNE